MMSLDIISRECASFTIEEDAWQIKEIHRQPSLSPEGLARTLNVTYATVNRWGKTASQASNNGKIPDQGILRTDGRTMEPRPDNLNQSACGRMRNDQATRQSRRMEIINVCSLESMFARAVKALGKEDEKTIRAFLPRLEKLVRDTYGIGWGYHDGLVTALFGEFPDADTE